MVEVTDRTPSNCEKPATSEQAAAEARDCKFDPKYAAPDTSKDLLNEVEFHDTEAEAQVQQNAALVREEMTGNWAWQTPDVEKLTNILSGMTVQGRQELIANYDQGESKFWDDAKYYLTEGSPEYAAIEVLMNEKAATGDAGNARVAMATLADDPEKGLNLLRAVVASKKGEQIATLDADYMAAFGTTLTDTIKNLDSSVMSSQNKAIFDILLKGSDNIGAQQIKDMAAFAVEGGDREMLINLLAGDRRKDIDARDLMLTDSAFMSAVTEKFPGVELDQSGNMVLGLDPEVSAALRKGKVSLDAILTEDVVGIYDNIENSNFNFANAPEQDRQAFRTGRDIVESGREPSTPVEKEAVRKYNDLVSAMSNVSAAQRAVLEDSLLHGEKTLISDIAGAYSEGGILGIGSGFYNHDALAAVENMTAHEYGLLKNPEYKAEFDRQVAAMIPDEALRTSVMDMVNAKLNVEVKTQDANPAGYTDSLTVRRSLDQFMTDLAESGNSANADRQIATRLSSLTAEEAQRYISSPEFKAQVDQFVSRNVNEPIAEAQVNLQLASAGREKTATELKLEQFLNGQVESEPATTDFQGQARRELRDIAQVEELMKDPELLAKMKLVAEQTRQRMEGQFDGEINPQDQLLYNIFNNSLPSDSRAVAIGAGTFDNAGIGLGSVSMPTTWERFLKDGEIPFNTKAIMSRVLPGDWLAGRYGDVAALSASEREQLRLTPEQQAIVDNALANGGQLDLAGRFREFAVEGGNIAPLLEEYAKLPEAKRQELNTAYRTQFGADRDLMAEARAGLDKNEEMSEGEKKVWERVIANKGDLQLVDRMQLFILGTDEKTQYSDFRAELSKLTPQQIFDLKRVYTSDYKGNLDDKFLAFVPEKDIDRYRDYMSLEEVDGVNAFFQRMARYEDLSTFDGTGPAHKRLLQVNENILSQFNDAMAKLPQDAQEKMAEYYSKTYQDHMDSNEEYAHFIADMTVTAVTVAAAIALTPATGGVSLGAIAGYATAGGTLRVGMIQQMQGGNFDSSVENVTSLGLVGAFQGVTALPLIGGRAVVTGAKVIEGSVVRETVEAVVKADTITATRVAETTGEVIVAQTDQATKLVPEATVAVEAAQDTTLVRAANLDAVPAGQVVEQVPAGQVVEQVPAGQVIEQVPVVRVIDKAPVEQVADEAPVEQMTQLDATAGVDDVSVNRADASEVFDATPPIETIDGTPSVVEVVRRAPAAFPVEAVVDDAVRMQEMRASYSAGTLTRSSLEKAAESDDVARNLLTEIKETERLAAAAIPENAVVAEVPEEKLIESGADDVVENADNATEVFDVTPTSLRVRMPEAFPVEAVVDDAVRMQEMRASYSAGTLTRSSLEKAAESDDVARNLLTEIKETERLAAAAIPENAVVAVATKVDDVADDATRLAQMEKDVAAGTITRESLEASAREGDVVAQRVLATLVKRDAEEIALQKAAMADAYEGVRLAAMTNYAGRVLQAAVGPTIVSNVVDSLEATEAPIEQPVEPAAPLPSDKLIEMATVRRGEGPWQSAERILAADGKQHGVDEVRALTRAFQAVYKAEHDGNGDMSGLKVKYNFVTRDNFDDLIAACNNAEVKAILLNMAQGMPVA